MSSETQINTNLKIKSAEKRSRPWFLKTGEFVVSEGFSVSRRESRLQKPSKKTQNAFQDSPTDEAAFTERSTGGCAQRRRRCHLVNWLGAEETVWAVSERRIDALKRGVEGQAAQWHLRDSL